MFYILCSEDMKKSDFVREIAKQVGAPTDGTNLRDMLEYAISMIAFLNNPLLIFDEGDQTDRFCVQLLYLHLQPLGRSFGNSLFLNGLH